jgi:hypothetical protein
MGLLLAAWLGFQVVSVMVCFMSAQRLSEEQRIAAEGYNPQHDAAGLRAAYWHSAILAVGVASLAIVFMVGAVGLAGEAPWAWRVLLATAVVQIAFTVATQVWEATKAPLKDGPVMGHEMGVLGAVIGILLWNLIPLGILLLAIQGGRLASASSLAQPATPAETET